MGQSVIQRSFAAGEIAPSLYGRADHVKFQTGLRVCRNFIVMRHGGVASRAGSQFIAEVKSSGSAHLLKFVFNDDQTYVIEAGSAYFRFYRQGAQIVVAGVTAWSALTNYVVGDLAVSGGVNYYCILAHLNQVPPNGTYWYPLTDTIYEIPTPYEPEDIAHIQMAQYADTVILTHPLYPPQQLSRFDHTRWTLTPFVTVPGIGAPVGLIATAGAGTSLHYSYLVTAVASADYEESLGSTPSAITCDPPTANAPNTLAWTATSGAVEYNVYLDQTGNGVFGFIGVASANAFNDIGYIPDRSQTPPVAKVLFNATGDYPATATFFQQRLLFAGSDNNPDQVDGSQIGYLANFSIHSPIQDDDAIRFKTRTKKVNQVQHLIDIGKLMCLGSSGSFSIDGDADGILKPTAINPRPHEYHGVSPIPPAIVGSTILYVQARGQIVRDLIFNFETQTFQGKDLTVFSPHLIDAFNILRMDFAETPQSILWMVRDDGALLGLTYVPDQEVWGWHRHDTGNGDSFEDVCVVPESDEDAVYVVVNRAIGGGTRRYIERFPRRWVIDTITNSAFADSYLVYQGAPATTVSGLDHLIGRTVTILADGNVLPNQVVPNSGTLSLDRAYSFVLVGLPITCDFQTLDLDVNGSDVRSKKKRIASISLLIEESRGILAGPDTDHLDAYQEDPPVAYGTPPDLLNGVIDLPITATWDESGRFVVRHSDPTPLTILAAIPNVDLGG